MNRRNFLSGVALFTIVYPLVRTGPRPGATPLPSDFQYGDVEDRNCADILPYLDGQPLKCVRRADATLGWADVIVESDRCGRFPVDPLTGKRMHRRVYGQVQLMRKTPELFIAWDKGLPL